MSRRITHIVIHCTATSQTATIMAIRRYWREKLKWTNPGYHYIIDPSGQIHAIQPEDKIANGVAGHNANSLHISYIGGVDGKGNAADNRTLAQKTSFLLLLRSLRQTYPDAVICGHRDFPNVKKACPSFDARREYRSI